MRNRNNSQNGLDWQPHDGETAVGAQSDEVWTGLVHPRSMLSFFRRRFFTIFVVASMVFGLGLAGYMLYPGKYSAQALILVDPRQPRVTLSEGVLPGIGGDAATLASFVQIMSSDGFLAKVVKKLNLRDDPAFSFASSEKELIDAFRSNMTADRQGATYIVEVTYTAKDAQKAALYANGIAQAFVSEQNGSRLDASTEAAEWLSQRLTSLRSNLKKSEDSVASYQAKNGIVETGNQNTLDSQQLTSLVNQLASAATEVEDAKARFDQAKRDGVPASSSSGQSGQFLNLNQLLQEQGNLRRQAALLNQTLGSRHPQILANKEQQRTISSQIQAEKRRLVQRTGQAYAAAKAKKQALERKLADARNRAIRLGRKSVELANLQREAKANRDLYEQFLARYKITDEQSQLLSDEAKIASAATPPRKSNKPSLKLVLPVLAVLGTVAGLITALILEAFAAPVPAAAREMQAKSPRREKKSAKTRKLFPIKSGHEEDEDRALEEGGLDDDEETLAAHRSVSLKDLYDAHNQRQKERMSPRRPARRKARLVREEAPRHPRPVARARAQGDQSFFDRRQGSDRRVAQGADFGASHERYREPRHDVASRAFYEPDGREAYEPSAYYSDGAAAFDTDYMGVPQAYERDNIHQLYAGQDHEDIPLGLDGFVFAIPPSALGKRPYGYGERGLTIRNLADNVLSRDVELSALLNDNFRELESFLHGTGTDGPASILVSSFSSADSQTLSADLLIDFAIEEGHRPILVTLSQAGQRRPSHARGEGDWFSGLQEYEDFDVIEFLPSLSAGPYPMGPDAASDVLFEQEFAQFIDLCKQNYDYVIVVAPQDLNEDDLDEMLPRFDLTMLVLDDAALDDEDLLEWQDWAYETGAGLVLDQTRI
ncbi:MAG: exopolysaccharide transport family protein [Cohaesibacter sp.]|nr:exopolysaccharide transport family protein [Cohaesibacter sp.]